MINTFSRTIWLLSAATAFPLLSACGSDGLATEITRSDYLTTSASLAATGLSSSRTESVSSSGIGTVSIVSGNDTTRGQSVALAGITGTPSVGAPVTTGTASYNANYRYVVIDNVVRTSTTIGGDRFSEIGTVTLAADFDAGTLTGTSTALNVNGTFGSGGTLGGSVEANYAARRTLFGPIVVSGTATGTLQGNVGNDGVIGVFHGRDSNTAFAGGFVGPKN